MIEIQTFTSMDNIRPKLKLNWNPIPKREVDQKDQKTKEMLKENLENDFAIITIHSILLYFF